jgi:hypothetical protein
MVMMRENPMQAEKEERRARIHLSIPSCPEKKTSTPRRHTMSIGTILLILLVLILVGALPTWNHSRSWGYYPSSGLGFVVLILLVLVLMGRI